MTYPEGFAACSFGFQDFEYLFYAMRDISKLGLVSDNHGLDPRKQKTAIMEMENASSIAAAKSIMKSSRNIFDGVTHHRTENLNTASTPTCDQTAQCRIEVWLTVLHSRIV